MNAIKPQFSGASDMGQGNDRLSRTSSERLQSLQMIDQISHYGSGMSASKRPKLDANETSSFPVQGTTTNLRHAQLLSHLGDGRSRPGDVLYD